MFYTFTQYLKFLLTSTNQHGVHSPFVYQFVTQCLYKKTKIRGPKSIKVLLKSTPYFNVENIRLVPEDPVLAKCLLKTSPQLRFNKKPYDLLYFDGCGEKTVQCIASQAFQNDCVIIVDLISQNPTSSFNWSKIKGLAQVTVSIDMYYCGVLFFRKEQVKEHFKIRI